MDRSKDVPRLSVPIPAHDPQAHATYGLGIDFDDLNADSEINTIADVLSEEHGLLDEILIATQEPNLKLAPSDIRIARTAALLHSPSIPARQTQQPTYWAYCSP